MDNRTRSAARSMTLRVGRRQGDLVGADDKVLQAGLDYLHRLGGGTLEVLPGEYTLRNALYLHPHLTLRGCGAETVLKKAPSLCSPLVRDSDWYENQIEVEDPTGFQVGDGIMLRARRHGELQVVKDSIVDLDGAILSLSRRLEKNMWLEQEASAASLFALLTAEWVDDVCIENLTLDGNRTHNEEINGNYAGAVFIQHCDRWSFDNVRARNYNGDGFSFQVCDDIFFADCRSEDNANLGFHPGSGSQRPIFKHCTARGNSQGIFFCWGVTHALAESCQCGENSLYGISIGHRDTDNHILDCTIEKNGHCGILLRSTEGEFRGAHRNCIERCRIRGNGGDDEGVGMEIRDLNHAAAIRDCHFESAGKQRIGLRIHPDAREVQLSGNRFEGLEEEVAHLGTELSPAS